MRLPWDREQTAIFPKSCMAARDWARRTASRNHNASAEPCRQILVDTNPRGHKSWSSGAASRLTCPRRPIWLAADRFVPLPAEDSDMTQDAFLCDAIRTPIGRYAGALSGVRADDLAAVPIAALKARN